jgi:hypothetical protein
MNEYEAHLSSYDHSHRQRMKEMKAMVRDPNATARARRQEAKDVGVVSIKLGEAAAGGGGTVGATGVTTGSGAAAAGGFKKGGFKKTGFKSAFAPAGAADGQKEDETQQPGVALPTAGDAKDGLAESDIDDEGYEMYDPRHPTD